MVTLKDWKLNKQFQDEYQEFMRTPCGVASRQVLVSMMLDHIPDLSKDADLIEVEAISSGFFKGYRQCYRNQDVLLPNFIESEKQAPQEFSPSGLPVDQKLLEQVRASLPKN